MKRIEAVPFEQRSEEWLKHRLGRFTSSEIGVLISTKNELTKGAETYVLTKASETLCGEGTPFLGSKATEWGNDFEEEAIAHFMFDTMLNVEKIGFVDYGEHAGGSPDGIIYFEDSCDIIEVKCPYNPTNHVAMLRLNSQDDLLKYNKNYYWQCVMNMLVTGARNCHFISYGAHEKWPGKYRLKTITVRRREDDIEKLKHMLNLAVNLKKQILKELNYD